MNLKKVIKATINKEIETKHTITNFSDGQQYTHMGIHTLDANPYLTTPGVGDPSGAANGTTVSANRVGSEVLAKGVRYKIFLQNNERFAQVKHRFLFIKCERGQLYDNTSIWMGRSDNKMLDDINHEKITVLYDKTFTINAPNLIAYGAGSTQDGSSGVGHGTYNNSAAGVGILSSQPGSKILTIYIPYAKDNKPKKLVYNDQNQPKFFDYAFLYMPYVVENTSTTLNVATINDMSKVFYFKDP